MVAALRRKHRIHVSPGTPEPVTSFDAMPQSVSNLEVSKLLMLMHAYAKVWKAATNLNLKEVAWGGIGEKRTLITNVWIVILAYFCNKKLIIVGAETAETQTLIAGTCAILYLTSFGHAESIRKYRQKTEAVCPSGWCEIWSPSDFLSRRQSRCSAFRPLCLEIMCWLLRLQAGFGYVALANICKEAHVPVFLNSWFTHVHTSLGTWTATSWHFGYQGCRLLEEEAHCLKLLNSNTALCGSSSGSGKTIAFLGPILASLGKPGKEFARALIVDPSRELATPSRIWRVVMFCDNYYWCWMGEYM